MVRDEQRPEPPEEKRDPDFILRSNRISLFLTVATLAATVIAVYVIFPRRDNELMTQAAIEHRRTVELELEAPTPQELRAWSAGSIGSRDVPWPPPHEGLELVGARSLEIQKRRTALVRYRVGETPVSLVAQRGRDVPPRKHRRRDDGETVISWRDGKWTMVAVGPHGSVETWAPLVGAH